jgi:hypothetical protein
MENPKDDTPCNNGPFSYNLRIQHEVDKIVQSLMKRIEQLEEKVHESAVPRLLAGCPQEAGR